MKTSVDVGVSLISLQLSSGSVPTLSPDVAHTVFKAGIWFDAQWATDWGNDTGLTSWD